MNNFQVTDILAATLNFNFDYDKIKEEMLELKDTWFYTPPYRENLNAAKAGKAFMVENHEMYDKIDSIDMSLKHPETKDLRGQHIFYLREHADNIKNTTKFLYIKQFETDGWDWIPDIVSRAPYTIKCIESLPFTKIGCIRVFVTENTFFATHRDSNTGGNFELSSDYARCLGVSLIPSTGNVPMSIQSFKTGKVYEVPGNAMLFNDSAFHGVKFTPDLRITIRVFGEVDFNKFIPYIDNTNLYYEPR
jgi:hypothetical protein